MLSSRCVEFKGGRHKRKTATKTAIAAGDRAVQILFLTVPALISLAFALSQAPLEVGSETQLFVDFRFVQTSENLSLKLHRPSLPDDDVIGMDHAWEQGGLGWSSMAEEDGIYKLWYEANGWDPKNKRFSGRFLCYATSRDARQWDKPALGLIDYNGSKENNIVMAGTWGTVFVDPVGKPDQRYKYVGPMREDPLWEETRGADGSIYVAYSADGIRWTRVREAALPFYCDTQNQAFWDSRIGKYVAYLRSWNSNLRTVSRVAVEDITQPWPYRKVADPFYKWGEKMPPALSRELPVVFSHDERDPYLSDHYNLCAIPYPYAQDVYIGLPSAYRHYDGAPHGGPPGSVSPLQKLSVAHPGNDGLLDIQLALSRDGIQWSRPDRSAFIPIGLPGSGRAASIYAFPSLIRRGDELHLFYLSTDTTHGGRDRGPGGDPDGPANFRKVHLRRAILPLHRFVSASTQWEGGSLTTPILTFSGRRLELNIDTSAMGSARVEILDPEGTPLEGFSLEDCDPISGNFLRHPVAWNGKSDLSGLSGRPLRLRFVMSTTDLFAFHFAP